MELIFKAALVIIAAILMLSMGTDLITGTADVVKATNYMEQASQMVYESNYSQEVIDACVLEAAQNGYTLTVDLTSRSTDKTYAKLVMTYDFEIDVINVSIEKKLYKLV